MNLQNRNRLTDFENKFMVTKGKRWGGGSIRRSGLTYTYTYAYAYTYIYTYTYTYTYTHTYTDTYTYTYMCSVAQLCPTLCDSMDCGLPGSSDHGISQAKNTEVGCHFLLQGIFPTQGSNPHLLLSPELAGRFFTTRPPGKLICIYTLLYVK